MASKLNRPGDDGPPFDFGPPGWGPPPPGGWGPPPPGGWGPPPPDEWGPPPPGGWGPPPPGGWGPVPPEGWGPRGPPPAEGWGPRGPPPAEGWGLRGAPLPEGWVPPPPGGWGPPPPEGWGLRGPLSHDWGPRGPPPPGWGRYPEDWLPPPDDWRTPHPDDWRRFHPNDMMPPPGWGPEGPPEHWGPEPLPPTPLPPPGIPLPDPAYGPPIPPPGLPPPVGYPGFPPGWTGEPVVEEVMPNPPPDQPEWIKALISAPATESAPTEGKKPAEEAPPSAVPASEAPTVAPRPKPAPKMDNTKMVKALGLLGKRIFDKPPPGRSTGIISFIGPSFGYIEREDLEKFTFSFDAFFGNPKAMTPGVRVHFTACKDKDPQQNTPIATDVKVAPGGTENVDTEIYEAVVSQPITEPQSGGRQYPGQVHVNIGPLRTNLTFESKDSTVTLLKNDQVLINLLTDIVTEKRRATNIRPKIPSTFAHTGETREEGVIISLKDNEGIIKSDQHGELPFHVTENFSDVELTTDDINEEVEFTVIMLKAGKQAIRIRRVKEPLLLTFCSATAAVAEDTKTSQTVSDGDKGDLKVPSGRLNLKAELGPNMRLDTELYEGIVTQTIIEPTPNMPGYPGQIHANIGPVKTNVTFDHRDCGVTLLKNDHVLINLLYDTVTGKRRAANIKPKVPFTFSYTKEKRELGIITCLGPEEGIINSDSHGELPFDACETFSDTECSSSDIHKEVEFTVAMVKTKKRAIRLLRTRRIQDQILQEQKKREEEDKKKKQDEEKRKKREEEQKRQIEVERKKEEVAAVLEAAKCKWTPLGFKIRGPDSMDDISKERFEGTVLRAICRSIGKVKTEAQEDKRGAEDAEPLLGKVKIKEENLDEDEGKQKMEIKTEEEEEEMKSQSTAAGPEGKAKPERDLGRLVMTVSGVQKQLPFSPNDLLSTATMLDGDKVRFNIATHRETKKERATNVEILPESFEESIEQRRHGIVIEFSDNSGLIKCTQNPQLYFHMSEVLEKKKLELNEKVEFSVVPHETADGGHQAIRIKRFTESVFLTVRKLCGVAANKGKMTIKLTKTSEDSEKEKPEAEKLKAVVKNLRTQDKSISKTDCSSTRHRYGRSRSRSRSHSRSRARSRSPPTDQFGRITKRRKSTSVDRKSSRYRRSRSRERLKRRSRSRSRSSSRSRSRSRERSKDRTGKKSRKVSRERDESYKRRREMSPPPRRVGVMEDELARKKRELEELDEIIAYKKSLVDRDPGQRTCIDYDHGRITIPLAEYKPVRSILKNRPEGPEYLHRPTYDDPYYDRPYSPYQDRRYGDRFADPYRSHPYDRPYADRPYADRPYESRVYGEAVYGGPPSASQRYTDRYDVYDEPFEDHYHDPPYLERPYNDPYRPAKRSQSPLGSLPLPQSVHDPVASTQPPLTQNAAVSSSHSPFRPPSPAEPPPKSPPPQRPSPPVEKQPLDRFLDMLSRKVDAEKKSEPNYVNDDLLPHERALQDGKGFSRIVGMAQGQPSSSQRGQMEETQICPKLPSVERTSEDSKSPTEPYDKIQSLLRTIGLKLSTGDVSKLANRAHERSSRPKSSSSERETLSSPKEEIRTSRTASFDAEHVHSPSPARSSSLEPLTRLKVTSEYEDFLDRQELEALKKAQQLQSLARTMGNTPSATSVKPPPDPPPAHYHHPLLPSNLPLGVTSQTTSSQSSVTLGKSSSDNSHPAQTLPGPPPGPPPRRPPGQTPPGPPPGPPPRRPSGQPPFIPSAHSGLPFIGQPHTDQQPYSTNPLQSLPTATPTLAPLATSSAPNDEQSAITTTVARCLKVIETVKSLAVQPPTKPVKSVQFSLPTEPSSASSPQASVGTEEDIKSKQKEKLDLYNQRILEKRELQYKEMLAWKKEKSKDGTLVAPGKPLSSQPKNVWICGHSLVYWAESRAKSPEVGMQLGMDPSKVTIWWKGTQGMTWPQLLPQLHQLKITWPNPDVLILHLGGNDLSTDSPTNLLAAVKKDLTSMRSIFPQCFLVWSNILPRRVWRHSSDSQEVDLVRTTVNRRIQNIISDLGGTSLTHDNIRCGTNTGLYRVDGVHLSPKGIDVFNLNLQDFLEKWEMSSEKS